MISSGHVQQWWENWRKRSSSWDHSRGSQSAKCSSASRHWWVKAPPLGQTRGGICALLAAGTDQPGRRSEERLCGLLFVFCFLELSGFFSSSSPLNYDCRFSAFCDLWRALQTNQQGLLRCIRRAFRRYETLMSVERTGCPPAAPTRWNPAPSSRCARPPASWSALPPCSSSSRKYERVTGNWCFTARIIQLSHAFRHLSSTATKYQIDLFKR